MTASIKSAIPANIGSVVTWRGMVKFKLQWGWVWLARAADGRLTAMSRDGKTDRTPELSSHEIHSALQFLASSPV